jgi:hypothetical protein
VKFVEGDLFEMDFSDATVVTLYLLPADQYETSPAASRTAETRHAHRFARFRYGRLGTGQTALVDGSTIYFWTVPAKKPETADK